MNLVERIAASLAIASPADLLAGDDDDASTEPVREAAVLVAITDRPDPGLILTHRSHELRDHGGQVAFPGGRVDEGEDARAAALREAWEEIALAEAHDPLGIWSNGAFFALDPQAADDAS